MHRIREKGGVERDTVSIKGGVIKGLEWKNGNHIFCRSAVVDIPEGVETWDGEPGPMEGRPTKEDVEKK
jgi:hypothetical protein